jgi:hypothetical protein
MEEAMNQGSESMFVQGALEPDVLSYGSGQIPRQPPLTTPGDNCDKVLNLVNSDQAEQIGNSSTKNKALGATSSSSSEYLPQKEVSRMFDALDESTVTLRTCFTWSNGSSAHILNVGQALALCLRNTNIMLATIFRASIEFHCLFHGMMAHVCSYRQGALFRIPSIICSPRLLLALGVPSLFGKAGAVSHRPSLVETGLSPFIDVKITLRLLLGTAVLVGSAEYVLAEANRKNKSKNGICFFLTGLVLLSCLGLLDSNLDLK